MADLKGWLIGGVVLVSLAKADHPLLARSKICAGAYAFGRRDSKKKNGAMRRKKTEGARSQAQPRGWFQEVYLPRNCFPARNRGTVSAT
jgi:hypothetical protein